MNNQVEGLQESIAKLRTDIKEAKGRGDERERQQRDQLQNMERRVALSIREADTAEAKLELMEGVIDKLKVLTYVISTFLHWKGRTCLTPCSTDVILPLFASKSMQRASPLTENSSFCFFNRTAERCS